MMGERFLIFFGDLEIDLSKGGHVGDGGPFDDMTGFLYTLIRFPPQAADHGSAPIGF